MEQWHSIRQRSSVRDGSQKRASLRGEVKSGVNRFLLVLQLHIAMVVLEVTSENVIASNLSICRVAGGIFLATSFDACRVVSGVIVVEIILRGDRDVAQP